MKLHAWLWTRVMTIYMGSIADVSLNTSANQYGPALLGAKLKDWHYFFCSITSLAEGHASTKCLLDIAWNPLFETDSPTITFAIRSNWPGHGGVNFSLLWLSCVHTMNASKKRLLESVRCYPHLYDPLPLYNEHFLFNLLCVTFQNKY